MSVQSKNNPLARRKSAEVMYKGKKIVPVRVVLQKRKFVAAQFEDGTLVSVNGTPITWSAARG